MMDRLDRRYQDVKKVSGDVIDQLGEKYVLIEDSEDSGRYKDILTDLLFSMILFEREDSNTLMTVTYIYNTQNRFKQGSYFDVGTVNFMQLDAVGVDYDTFSVNVEDDRILWGTSVPDKFMVKYNRDYKQNKSLIKEYGIGVLKDE